MSLYKVTYVEMTPDEAEESDGLELLDLIAEIDGNVDDAVCFWAADQGYSIVNWKQLTSVNKEPEMYMSPCSYIYLGDS
ncbi:hypothetical protein [Anabaena sp. FACHB-83]|uniref:hypothetical protein n=1 Tax=Anabaena sp. FACHB-83 TaxID=2692772 RepID=UPI00168B91CD|nr:hypothetical protein [Anabaena sp. FACHB-83]MBD2479972.1 hypothetical protein [Anabaena sp. FACHB-83]